MFDEGECPEEYWDVPSKNCADPMNLLLEDLADNVAASNELKIDQICRYICSAFFVFMFLLSFMYFPPKVVLLNSVLQLSVSRVPDFILLLLHPCKDLEDSDMSIFM